MKGTVLITGATSGFGKATAIRFINEGWRVIGTGRRADRLAELKSEFGDAFHPAVFDISDKKAIDEFLASLPAEFQDIDILVNNAGLALGVEPAHKTNLDEWETMIDTNVKGLVYMTRAVLPGMVERGRGHVVNLGSVAGNYPYPGGNVYCATKAFVKQFTLCLRADLAGTPIRMTNVEPGLCETEFSVVRFRGDKSAADKVYQGTEPIVAEDIAEIIHWVSNLPKHVNINRVEVMPTCQGFSPFNIVRGAD
jgi:3-hydroxy acid dehydrogenase/malonic semialdehyde reductase